MGEATAERLQETIRKPSFDGYRARVEPPVPEGELKAP